MALVLTAVGVLGVLAMLLAWTMAALVLANGRGRLASRALAALLFMDGVGAGTGNGIMFLTDDAASAYAWQVVAALSYVALPALYALFLSTLDAPPARPLRAAWLRAAIAVAATLALASAFLRPRWFIVALVQPWYAPYDQQPGLGFTLALVAIAAMGVWGAVISVSALRRAGPGSSARARARAYVLAFVTRDALFSLGALVLPLVDGAMPGAWWADLGFQYAILASLTILAYVPLLAYGILKTQLFDIDLRIKRGIAGGTIGVAFLAVFFVVSSVAESYLNNAYGYLVGGASAGLLLFALAPLQRAAERVADVAMPRVQATDEYVAFRKHEVYRQAVLDAAADGVVTPRERAVLDGLRRSLRLDARVADEIERTALPLG